MHVPEIARSGLHAAHDPMCPNTIEVNEAQREKLVLQRHISDLTEERRAHDEKDV